MAILAPVFLFIASAQGRIGDTEAEIRARYGDPGDMLPSSVEDSLTKHYVSGGFSIAVTYIHGRSTREILAKADKSRITDKEIQLLLDANAGGCSWNVQRLDGQENAPAGLRVWRADKSSRVAFYDSLGHAFFVTTQHFIDLTNATNRRAAVRMQRGPLVTGGHGERLMRGVQKGAAAAMLRDRQAVPSPSPARK